MSIRRSIPSDLERPRVEQLRPVGVWRCGGGTGKISGRMQTASTFVEAGWDFVGETANGTQDIWWIEEGQDYPRLWWELPAVGAGPPQPQG